MRVPPNAALLLHCARTRIDSVTADAIRSLVQGEIAWMPSVQLAHSNGVLSLLFKSLSTNCPDAVPAPVMARLRSSHAAAAQHNAVFARELLVCSISSMHRGFYAVAFKGPALAAAAFGDVSLRHFNDIDILVAGG